MKPIFLILISVLIITACQSNQSSKPMTTTDPSQHKIIVKEVIQVSEYTYLHVDENGTDKWLATPPVKAEAGETYYYDGGFEMVNFKSKELDRNFESILFVEGVSSTPIAKTSDTSQVSPGAMVTREEKKELKIDPIDAGVRISDLYSKSGEYAGKTIKLKGQVVKFSPEIMETNWIHIQDGTEFEGNYEITVTSPETVAVGDIVTLEGTITLDKDLGFGYFYPVLMENAKILK